MKCVIEQKLNVKGFWDTLAIRTAISSFILAGGWMLSEYLLEDSVIIDFFKVTTVLAIMVLLACWGKKEFFG